jgi:membrane protease YdiL (CAAX protease family)
MGKFSDIVRENKLYTVLFIFILLVNVLIFADWMAERSEKRAQTAVQEKAAEEEPVQPPERKLFDEEDIKVRQEKLQDLADEKPLLYLFLGLFNLLILFVIFVGLLLDMYFLVRWTRKEPLRIQLVQQENPRWDIADVVRVTLIFLSFGYVFVILQAFVAKLFPILYNENFRMVFNTAAINVVGISVILYFVAGKYGQAVDALGLTSRKFSRGVFYAVVGYIALVPIFLAIMTATFYVTKLIEYRPPVQPIVRVFMEEKETGVLWLSALFAAVFGPIAEEIFFRGFMYRVLRVKLGIFWAMAVTSAVFAFLHTHIVGFLPIMALGMLLAYLYEKTGSLVTPISVHIIHNVGMVMLVFLVRGIGT